ncbi:MAG TPA: hypothetical protein VL793_12435 [Patescibacteria group bacterium]|nr:hypothetical protein [Patescibacteria group bacterium]
MSEFKFACPVCGQHITADSSTSGTPLECPTCFQTLIVPNAPAFGEGKLVLTAAKATTGRKTGRGQTEIEPKSAKLQQLKSSLVPLTVLLATGGVAFLLWHNQLANLANRVADRATGSRTKAPQPVAFQSSHPVPNNVSWTLNPTNAAIPNGPTVGSIHGYGFLCERAVLKGDRLSLRQGPAGPPELGLTVSLAGRRAEELAGKTILVSPATPVPAPRVVLRWKDDQQEPVTQHIHAGYAMKLTFGRIADNKIYGRIYIALPDEQRSFAGGNFEAEISRPTEPLAGR